MGKDDIVSLGVPEWEVPGGLPEGCPMSQTGVGAGTLASPGHRRSC